MVISFFSGAGGHRYKLFLKGIDFDAPNRQMHNTEIAYIKNRNAAFLDEFYEPFIVESHQLITTHTMATALIKEKLPGHDIIRIFCNLKDSLRRKWEVDLKYNYVGLPLDEQMDGMFQLIKFNIEYYKKFPIDRNADVIIDIEKDDSLFTEVMRKELKIINPEFDFVWDVYKELGPDAPIICIVNNEYKI
jgi:hypothetical protein